MIRLPEISLRTIEETLEDLLSREVIEAEFPTEISELMDGVSEIRYRINPSFQFYDQEKHLRGKVYLSRSDFYKIGIRCAQTLENAYVN